MADLKYYDVILKPVVTEKAMRGFENMVYSFYVHPDATKIQIRESVEKMFPGALVESVNTMNVKGRLKRRGRTSGFTAKRKKAIVALKAGSKDIEIFKGM
ncbi:MAG: 50S ribosomal protein L23 [Clostridiales bacterium]|jgi:large subunit ribosomal protein L23|nr:50S ribosomal protein L23 [Clostridiales bacterium]